MFSLVLDSKLIQAFNVNDTDIKYWSATFVITKGSIFNLWSGADRFDILSLNEVCAVVHNHTITCDSRRSCNPKYRRSGLSDNDKYKTKRERENNGIFWIKIMQEKQFNNYMSKC